MPRSKAGKRRREEGGYFNTKKNDVDDEEEEEEDGNECEDVREMVREKFDGDAHKALFSMLQKSSSVDDDDVVDVVDVVDAEEEDEEESSEADDDETNDESDEPDEEDDEDDVDDDHENDADDEDLELEWEAIPEDEQKVFDQMGPQDDISDVDSDAEEELIVEEEEEENHHHRSLNNTDVENEERDNALTLHLKRCQNETEKTLENRRGRRCTFTEIPSTTNGFGDIINDRDGSDEALYRWEMSDTVNVDNVPLSFTKTNNNNSSLLLKLPSDIPSKIREHWKTVRMNEIRELNNKNNKNDDSDDDDDDDDDDDNNHKDLNLDPECFKNKAQADLYRLASSYADILHTRRIPDLSHLKQQWKKKKKKKNGAPQAEDSTLRWRNQKDDELDAVLIHALTHIHRTRNRVTKHNEKLAKKVKFGQEISIDETPRDQGFARPTVLFLSPMRNVCGRAIMRFLKLCPNAHGRSDAVNKLERLENDFLTGYSDDETSSDEDDDGEEDVEEDEEFARRKKKMQQKKMKSKKKKYKTHVPLEYKELFRGNEDDHFRLGVKITKAAVRPFVDFFGADIVFASPLGIVTAMNDDATACDFLSAIELVIVDRCDVIAMQNWEHLETVLEKCNNLPKDAKDVDVNRCHEFHLNGASASARQTIFLTNFETAEINATFNGRLCANIEGKYRLRAVKEKGVLGAVASMSTNDNNSQKMYLNNTEMISRQEFELVRVSKKNIQDADDVRFRHFARSILPRIRENPDQGQLIFCSTYFEFVRVRNLLVDREVSFSLNSEYTDIAEAARARTLFADGRKRCLLISERAYFYQRRQIRGVNSVFFYSLPENAQFYVDICNFMKLSNTANTRKRTDNNNNINNQTQTLSASKQSHCLFTRLDALKIERVCGTTRGKKMLLNNKTSRTRANHDSSEMFVFC